MVGAYFFAARIGLFFHYGPEFSTLIWPPTSVAVAALFLWGYELWPAVMCASLLVCSFLELSAIGTVGSVLGATVEVFVGVYVLRRVVVLDPMLGRLRDAIGLIATSVSITIIGASVATLALGLGGDISAAVRGPLWFSWWLSDSLTMLVSTPFLIRWMWKPFFVRTVREFVEGSAAFGLLVVANVLVFWSSLAHASILPLAYLFAPLLWVAIRLGPRGITLANALTAAFALSSAYFGHGVFAHGTTIENLFLTQGFVGIIASVFFIVASSVEELRETEAVLEGHIGKLEGMVERVSSEDKAKTEFIAVLAHELRNPLAPIVSAIELVRINGVRPENAKLFETIEIQTRTIGRLLDDLLDISRISHEKLILQKEPVELQSIITRAVETVDRFMQNRQHSLSVVLPEQSLWLYGDSVRLTQIFINLLYNAGKYTKSGGRVTLTAQWQHNSVRISITDTGIGIDSRLFKKIFEPFVQGDGAPSEVGTGLGVGLALSKRLAELHGGTISVASEGPGKGSVFTVTLPLSRFEQTRPLPQKREVGARMPAPLPRSARQLRVLIVDDNEYAADALRQLLEHIGHTVAVVHRGIDAIAYVAAHSPEAVLLDIGLPDISGYEVAKQLRAAQGPTLVLIALSGYGQREDKQKALAVGFTHHLTKPARIADIEKALQTYVKK